MIAVSSSSIEPIDREAALPVITAKLLEDERKRLDGADDDLLAGLEIRLELLGLGRAVALCHRADGCADLGELLDGLADLPVEEAAVGDDDDRIEHARVALVMKSGKLVRNPSDGFRFA